MVVPREDERRAPKPCILGSWKETPWIKPAAKKGQFHLQTWTGKLRSCSRNVARKQDAENTNIKAVLCVGVRSSEHHH